MQSQRVRARALAGPGATCAIPQLECCAAGATRHVHNSSDADYSRCKSIRASRTAHQGRAVALRAYVSPQQATVAGSQLFFELLVVWQQLASRMTLSEGGSGESQLLLKALKIVIACLMSAPLLEDGRPAAQRAIALSMQLADLSASGVPIDAESIAAAIVCDGVISGHIPFSLLQAELGPEICALVHEIQLIRDAPLSIDSYDDRDAGALREMLLSMCDVRAIFVQIVCEMDRLQNAQRLPQARQHVLAMQVLQIYSPLGHALGLSVVSSSMDDICFKILFPQMYGHVCDWLSLRREDWLAALSCIRVRLERDLQRSSSLRDLGVVATITMRAKSPFSLMKKVLELSDFSRGGRAISDVQDLLGIRVVLSSADERQEVSHAALEEACFVVESVVARAWTVVPQRRKDYVSNPKPNGYQSLHMAIALDEAQQASASGPAEEATLPIVEIQIRTDSMNAAAELGAASHFSYKSGLAVQDITRLKDWTQALLAALSVPDVAGHIDRWADQRASKLLLPSSADPAARATDSNNAAPSPPNVASNCELERLSLLAQTSASCSLLANVPAPASMPVEEDMASAARAFFEHLDLNGDGTVSLAELQAFLEGIGETSAEAEAAQLALSLAMRPGSSDEITFDDFYGYQQSRLLPGPQDSEDGGGADAPSSVRSPGEGDGAPSVSSPSAAGQPATDSGPSLDGGNGAQASAASATPAFVSQRPLASVICGSEAPAVASGPHSAPTGGSAARLLNGASFLWSHSLGLWRHGPFARSSLAAAALPPQRNSATSGSVAISGDRENGSDWKNSHQHAAPQEHHAACERQGSGDEQGAPSTSGRSRSQDVLQRPNRAWGNVTILSENESESSDDESTNGLQSSLLLDLDSVPSGLQEEGWTPSDSSKVGASSIDEDDAAPAATASTAPSQREFKLTLSKTTRVQWARRGAFVGDGTCSHIASSFDSMELDTPSARPLTAAFVPCNGPLVVGADRRRFCDIILDDGRVSGRHAFFQILPEEGGTYALIVTDMSSTNGTYVNGKRLQPWQPCKLQMKDIVTFGSGSYASFRVDKINRKEHQASSPIDAMYGELRANGYKPSFTAWSRNKGQRTALGLIRYPNSAITRNSIAQGSETASWLVAQPREVQMRVAVPFTARSLRVRRHPSKAHPFARFESLCLEGDIAGARQSADYYAASYPTDARAWIMRAELHVHIGKQKIQQARANLHAALKACDIAEQQLQGIADAGGHASDLVIYGASQITASRVRALILLGDTEWRARLYAPARQLWSLALQHARQHGAPWMIEQLLWRWAKAEIARSRWRRPLPDAIAAKVHAVLGYRWMCHTSTTLRMLTAEVHCLTGQSERALALADQLLSEQPESAVLALWYATMPCATHAASAAALKRAHDSQGNDPAISAALLLELARVHALDGHLAFAEACLQHAMDEMPEDNAVPVELFQSAETSELFDARLALLQSADAGKAARTFVDKKVAAAQLSIVRACIDQGELERAESMAEAALKTGFEQLNAHTLLALVHGEQGRWADAKSILIRALKLEQVDALLARAMSRVLSSEGQKRAAQALESFACALERGCASAADQKLRKQFAAVKKQWLASA